MGLAKERLQCLRGLRVRVDEIDGVAHAESWINAPCALHNLCVNFGELAKPTVKRRASLGPSLQRPPLECDEATLAEALRSRVKRGAS